MASDPGWDVTPEEQAWLDALDAPRPAPPEPTGVLAVLLDAMRDHRKRYYGVNPVEARMQLATARRLAAEAGFKDATASELSDGALVMGLLVAIDESVEPGAVAIWPTPDEKMWTAIAAKQKRP